MKRLKSAKLSQYLDRFSLHTEYALSPNPPQSQASKDSSTISPDT
jgi:hypothetical protein